MQHPRQDQTLPYVTKALGGEDEGGGILAFILPFGKHNLVEEDDPVVHRSSRSVRLEQKAFRFLSHDQIHGRMLFEELPQ
jgi:hypothetical protein